MLFVLSTIRRKLLRWRTGLPAVIVMVVVFVTSWPLMAVFEPAENEIADPENYWWWFIVSASTVGYGDQFPVSTGGRAVGVYVIIGAIAALTSLLAQLAQVIEKRKGRRMRGEMTVKASDHVVILGYLPDRTERIVRDLVTDGRRHVVVCGWEGVTNPFAENEADFVRGDLTEPEVLRRAGIDRARSVLIDARDDNEALAMLVSVHHVNPTIHTVVALRDLSRADHLKFVHDGARCVQWHTPRMAAEELKDPGIARVYTELMTNRGGNTYSMRLGEELGDVSFGELQAGMGRKHAATVLAVDSGGAELMVSPGWETPIPQGSVIYYVSRHRLSKQDVVAAAAAFAS